jgi:integrase
VTAGLRQGELLGLKWEDMDFEAGTLEVRRGVRTPAVGACSYPQEWQGSPNTAHPKRRGSSKESPQAPPGGKDAAREALYHGLVFPSQVGTPLWARNLNRSYKRLLGRARLSTSFRCQDLRHTCATLLLRQSVNQKFIQYLVGHGDVSLTLNVYSHVSSSMKDQTATAIDDALR